MASAPTGIIEKFRFLCLTALLEYLGLWVYAKVQHYEL